MAVRGGWHPPRLAGLWLLTMAAPRLLLLLALTWCRLAAAQHTRTAAGWCGGGAEAWADSAFATGPQVADDDGNDVAVSVEEALTLLLGVEADIEDGVRRGCVDRRSVDFDAAASLDDGSCRSTFTAGDPCLGTIERAWDACTGAGDACGANCSSASDAATESLTAESCATGAPSRPHAQHIAARTPSCRPLTRVSRGLLHPPSGELRQLCLRASLPAQRQPFPPRA